MTEYAIPTLDGGVSIIVAGVRKELWFTEYKANKNGIVLAQDGGIWFAGESNKIGQLIY